jgi:hypothetical protein
VGAMRRVDVAGIRIEVEYVGLSKPHWEYAKDYEVLTYQVTLGNKLNHKCYSYKYYDSITNTESKTAKEFTNSDLYGLIEMIGADTDCPDTFAQACSEWGYSPDSIKDKESYDYWYMHINSLRDITQDTNFYDAVFSFLEEDDAYCVGYIVESSIDPTAVTQIHQDFNKSVVDSIKPVEPVETDWREDYYRNRS